VDLNTFMPCPERICGSICDSPENLAEYAAEQEAKKQELLQDYADNTPRWQFILREMRKYGAANTIKRAWRYKSQPWTPTSHAFFPRRARHLVYIVLLCDCRYRNEGSTFIPMDILMENIFPMVMDRRAAVVVPPKPMFTLWDDYMFDE